MIKHIKLRYHRLMVKFGLAMAKITEKDFTTYWKWVCMAEDHYNLYWRIERGRS